MIGPRQKPVLILALALLVVATVARVTAAILTRGEIDPVSETWLALAFDASQGVIYRPLLGVDGYGGTRYFPLQFLLHGGLLRIFGDAILSGYAITCASLCGLLGAAYLGLLRAGLSRAAAASASILLLASAAVQIAIVAMKGDLLPAALALGGFVCCVRASGSPRWWLASAAGVLFGFAFLAKVTSIAGPLAGVAILLCANRFRLAVLVVASTLAVAGLGLFAVQFFSDGRFISVFAACASGGMGIREVLRAPYGFLRNVWFLSSVSIPLSILAVIAFPSLGMRLRSEPWSIYLLCVFAMTLAIHTTYGVELNHLIDLEVASVMWLASRVSKAHAVARLAPSASAVVAFVAAFNLLTAPAWGLLRRPDSGRGTANAAAAALAKTYPGKILSTAPLIPVLAGQRSFLLDHWMFELLEKTRGGFVHDLQERIRRRDFSAVVLRVGPGDPLADVDAWLGSGTLATINQAYPEKRRIGDLEVRLHPVETGSGEIRAPSSN
jgi:hypothetical protein